MHPASNADGIWVAVHQWRLLACLWGYQSNGSWHSAHTIFTNVTFTLLYINPNLFTGSKIKLLCKQPRSICCTVKNTPAWEYWSIRWIHDQSAVDSPEKACLWLREISLSLLGGRLITLPPHGNKRTWNSQHWSDFKYCLLSSLWTHTDYYYVPSVEPSPAERLIR